ncbi:MAG: helix-turn-helix domain-containing protein [Anaerolineales bacterium]|nr:helix-turn-helix domain-containing protein [Anaerolineales bacterium]
MLGKKILARRKELGLSLRDLGNLTNLSASFLSQVENDLTSPSISSLQTIATALRIPMFTFLDDDHQTEVVVRGDARKRLSFPNSHLVYELLTSDLNRQMMGFIVKLSPGANYQAQQLFRPTEEMMYVLQGAMNITIGERIYRLESGDSIYYEGAQLRGYTSVGDIELVVICCMTPPAL